MKRLLPLVLFLLVATLANAQRLTNAFFVLNAKGDGFRLIELELDERFVVAMTGDGEIRYVETLEGNEELPVTYYDKFDIHDLEGRVKTLGDLRITYNNAFDIHEVRGTLKSIGDLSINYFNVFDLNGPGGKVKSVGAVTISCDGRERAIQGNNRFLTVVY